MTEFRFSNDHNAKQAADVIDTLRQPRLWIPTEKDYPNHNAWLEKTEGQISSGTKRAMAAYFGKKVVGAVVYQRHEEMQNVLEVGNISVSPEAGGRYVGSFLLRNSETEGVMHDFPGVNQVMVDTKQNNTEMISFLINHGYELREIADLYGSGTSFDAVFVKSLDTSSGPYSEAPLSR